MSRGVYRPLGLKHRAPVLPGVTAIQRIVIGGELLGVRREAGGAVAESDAGWWHSVTDRQNAIEQIGAGFRDFATELAQCDIPDPARAAATAQWVDVSVLPVIREWNSFAERESGSWWVRASTAWPTFRGWMGRLRHLRESARAHGLVLMSPEPEPLPETVLEVADAGKGSKASVWIGIAKSTFGAAIMIAGGLTVFSIARDLVRSGRNNHQ